MLHAIIFWLTMVGFAGYSGSGFVLQGDPWGESINTQKVSSQNQSVDKFGYGWEENIRVNKSQGQGGGTREDIIRIAKPHPPGPLDDPRGYNPDAEKPLPPGPMDNPRVANPDAE